MVPGRRDRPSTSVAVRRSCGAESELEEGKIGRGRRVQTQKKWRRSGQSVTASDFGSNGPRFESGRGRCVESLDKALYSHCPKEKPSH